MKERIKIEKQNLLSTGALLIITLLLLLKELEIINLKIIPVIYGLFYGILIAASLIAIAVIIFLCALWKKENKPVKELFYSGKKKPTRLNNSYNTKLLQIKNLVTILTIIVNVRANGTLTGVLWLPVILTFMGIIFAKVMDLILYLEGISKYHYHILHIEKDPYNSKILNEYFELVDNMNMDMDMSSKEGKEALSKLSKKYYMMLTNNYVI